MHQLAGGGNNDAEIGPQSNCCIPCVNVTVIDRWDPDLAKDNGAIRCRCLAHFSQVALDVERGEVGIGDAFRALEHARLVFVPVMS